MAFSGIDPGFGGALVLIDGNRELIEYEDMPVIQDTRGGKHISPSGLFGILHTWNYLWKLKWVVIERIWTNKKLVGGTAVIESVLAELGIGFTHIDTGAWQRYRDGANYHKGRDKAQNKARSLAWAHERYGEQITRHDVAEALIMANILTKVYDNIEKYGELITAKKMGLL